MSEFSKKELIISGCSMIADYVNWRNNYHEKHYRGSDRRIIKWNHMISFPLIDYHIAKKYDMIPVNLACTGSGNKQIYNKLVDYILLNHQNIGLVIACWTTFTRIDFEIDKGFYRSMVYRDYEISNHNKMFLNQQYDHWKLLYDMGHIFPQRDINDFYRYSIMLSLLCQKYDIKLIQCSSIFTPPCNNILGSFLSHPLFDKIDEENFYGWPIFPELRGKILWEPEEKYMIVEFDNHPNELGHQMMANKLIQFIDDRKIFEKNNNVRIF